jgi:hypothetical protein
MYRIELTLLSLWSLGILFGMTMGGLIHVLGLAGLALVAIEDTPLEQRFRSLFTH